MKQHASLKLYVYSLSYVFALPSKLNDIGEFSLRYCLEKKKKKGTNCILLHLLRNKYSNPYPTCRLHCTHIGFFLPKETRPPVVYMSIYKILFYTLNGDIIIHLRCMNFTLSYLCLIGSRRNGTIHFTLLFKK